MKSICAFIVICFLSSVPASAYEKKCVGDFHKVEFENGFQIDTCYMHSKVWKQVMKHCSIGDQCEISGDVSTCVDNKGKATEFACEEMKKLKKARKL